MSNQLDKKLEEIQLNPAKVFDESYALSHEDIQQIKQAFIDGGWLPIEAPVKKYLDAGGDTDYIVLSRRDAKRNGII